MHPVRRKKLALVVSILVVVGVVVGLVTYALRQNINLFYTPTQIANHEAPKSTMIRVGGMVEEGSFSRDSESLKSQFRVVDTRHSLAVVYTGILPDLFREGQGVVARGMLTEHNQFIAEEVLAKHDENYMPPEVKDSLEKQGYWKHSESDEK